MSAVAAAARRAPRLRATLFALVLTMLALAAPGSASAATTCTAGTPYSNAVLGTSGVAGYWRLGDTSGTQACDGRGLNPGTYLGGFTLGQAGALAGDSDAATLFDGTSGRVSVPSATALNTADVFTFEAWVKRGSVGTTQVVATKQGTAWTLLFNTTNNLVLQQSGANIVASTSTVTDTTGWHHVATTKSGTTVKLYIDGKDVTGTVTKKTLANTTSPLLIGQNTTGGFFKGSIDEAALYSTALSAAQISNHNLLARAACPAGTSSYAGTIASTAGLVSHWRLGETTGTTACDTAGRSPGTYAGTFTLGQTGAIPGDSSKAALLDGLSGNVSFPAIASLDTGDTFSIEAWTKRGSVSTTANQVIASKQGSAWTLLYNASNQLVLQSAGVNIVASTSTVADTTTWHHVVATKSGATVKLYLDGRDVTGTVTNRTLVNTTSPLVLGQTGASAGWFKGSLDEVALYSTALPASEVSKHWGLTQPPANTAVPSVGGTARDGQTLTATTGTWSGNPTSYSYQWQSCSPSGTNCANVAGATSSTYALGQGDVGTTLRVVVTATNSIGSQSATSQPSAVVQAAAPANTANPAITGTAESGQVLTASNGTWTGTAPLTYSYQWQSCDASGASCSSIAGATSQTYTLGQGDVGTTVRVVVTATNSAGAVSATSQQTAVVQSSTPFNTAPPTVTGTAAKGQTLTVDPGTWTGTPTYSYQWQSCDASGNYCANIGGGTGATFALSAGDVGTTLRVVVTAAGTSGSTAVRTVPSAVVQAAARQPANTSAPSISGTAVDGERLTGRRGTWSGTRVIGYTYQWQSCDAQGGSCTAVAGATNVTYQLTAGDVGRTLRVVTTATNAAGTATATSGATAAVQAPAAGGGGTNGSGAPDGAIRYVHDQGGRLAAVMDPANGTAVYNWDPVGNLLSIDRRGASELSVLGVAPYSGTTGTRVTLEGTGFSPVAADDHVEFGGTAANVLSATGNELVVAVPAGATTGPVSVTVAGSTATSAKSFTVEDVAPSISGISPDVVMPGDPVDMTGRNFNPAITGDLVTVNGTMAETTTATATTLQFKPPATGSGRVAVRTPAGDATGPDLFIPPSRFTPSDVESTGRVALGGTSNVSIAGETKIGMLLFDATAGQRIAIRQSGGTFQSIPYVSVLKPDGSSFLNPSSNQFIDGAVTPVSGTYAVIIDPNGNETGSVDLTVYDASDAAATITPGGAPVTVTTTSPGQNAALTFAGTAGQRVSLREWGFNLDHGLSVKAPDGTNVWSSGFSTTDPVGFSDALTLPSTGTYTIMWDPQGTRTGSSTFALYDIGSDITGTLALTPAGSSATVAAAAPGQNGRFTFTATAGQKVSVTTARNSYQNLPRVQILRPDGSSAASQSNASFIDAVTLSATGTYTLVVDPSGGDTGSVDVTLYDARDASATITPGGDPVTITTIAPGQNGAVTFDGTAGQRVSLRETKFAIDHGLSVRKPDGSTLWSSGYSGSDPSAFSDAMTLPVTGTYTIVWDPGNRGTGSTTFTLSDLPADPGGAIPFTSAGATRSPSMTVPGQNARYTFSATAGQRVSVTAAGSTFTTQPRITIQRPDGSNLTSQSSATFVDAVTIPTTGTYTLVVDPQTNETGTVDVTLYDASDATGTITPGGAAVKATTVAPGQNASLTFSGTAGQRVSMRATGFSVDHSMSIRKPDGSTVWSGGYGGTEHVAFSDAQTLPVTGTYTVVWDPGNKGTGSISIALYDLPADVGGTLTPTPAGATASPTTTTPGQNARYTFSATQGQRVSVTAGANTYPTQPRLTIQRPDGSNLISQSSAVFLDGTTIPTTGTYTLIADPQGVETGSVDVTLFDASDATATLTPSAAGASATLTAVAPGQNGTATFSGTAGQRIALRNSKFSIDHSLAIRKPDGSNLWSSGYSGTESTGFSDVQTLPTTGTYTIFFDPGNRGTGPTTLTLYDVPADVTGPLTPVPAGATTGVATTVPGQNARYTFSGTAGQKISATTSASTYPNHPRLLLLKPDGTTLTSASSSTQLSTATLPSTGTYTVVVDPQAAEKGDLMLTVFDGNAVTPTSGGTATTVTSSTGGQVVNVPFSATAGQKISVTTSGSTYPSTPFLQIVKPDGTNLTSQSAVTFIDATVMPVTGSYKLVVTPQASQTGSMTVTIYDATEAIGSMAPSTAGSKLTIGTQAPGQMASVTFSGTVGQRVALRESGFNVDHVLTIRRPDGTNLYGGSFASGSTGSLFTEALTLPATGTYTILYDPLSSVTGPTTLTLYDVPADIAAPLTPTVAGAPATASIAVPGQTARYTFSGTTGQRVSATMANSTYAARPNMSLVKPDGTQLGSQTSSGFLDGQVLPASGTYTLLVDPIGVDTGDVDVKLFDASDATATITPGGASVTISPPAPGANGSVTFSGTAGQRVSLRGTGFNVDHWLSIKKPDGTTLWGQSFISAPNGSSFSDVQTLPATGIYTIVYDPISRDTSPVRLTLNDVPADTSGTLTPTNSGAQVAVATTVAGQNARYTFSGTAGQRISATATGNTYNTRPSMFIVKPDGNTLSSQTNGGFLDAQTLPTAGTYTLVLDPAQAETGSVDVTLYDASDATTTITPGGAPATITTTAPGQNGAVTFSGTAGQRVSLRGSAFAVDHWLSIKKPDGTNLWGLNFISASNGYSFSDALSLPATGTYTIAFDPISSYTGSTKLTLSDVGPDAGGPATPTVDGTPLTVSTTVAGQNASFPFSGTAGQRVSVAASNSTFTSRPSMWIVKPDGSQLGSQTSSPFLDGQTLPTTGTYTLVVNPQTHETGSMDLRLYDASDATATLSPSTSGSSASLTTAAPGQNASVTFSASAGQRVAVRDSGFSSDHWLSIRRSDGSTIWGQNFISSSSAYGFSDPVTIPSAGTYTIMYDPLQTQTGPVRISLYDVPADVTGTLNPSGSGATANAAIAVPGQNARYTFAGTAGQRIAVNVADNSYPNRPTLTLLRPDGSSVWSRSSAFVDATSLPTTGTYTLVVDPQTADTGAVKVKVYDAPDVTGSLTPSTTGASTNIATTVPGQNATLTFSGTAGQRISVRETGFDVDHYLSVKRPDGSTIWGPSFTSASSSPDSFSDALTLPSSGTYTVTFDPLAELTGSAKLTLWDVSSDAGGPLTLSGAGASANLTTVPGQNGAYTFAGSAGQKVSVLTSRSSYPGSVYLSIVKPDGTDLVRSTWTNFVDPVTLPSTGTYKLLVNPNWSDAGSMNVALYEASDVTGTIALSGPSVTAATTAPGSNARLTFSGTAGSAVKLVVSDVVTPAYVSILQPDGSYAVSQSYSGTNGTTLQTTLAQTGTYTVVVDPQNWDTTRMQLSLRPQTAGSPKLAARGGEAGSGPSIRTSRPHHRRHRTERWRKLPRLRAARGVTAVSGQALNLDGTPIAGVRLSVEGSHARARTDRTGRFLLRGVRRGHRVMTVDGARARGRSSYGKFTAGIDVRAGRTNVLPYTTWLPRIDRRAKVDLRYPLRRDLTLTTKRIPGLEVRIPAGSVARDEHGKRVKQLTVTPIPVHQPPFPLPRKVEVPVYFTIQPGGAYLSKGAQLIYPNPGHIAAGARVNFWTYDAVKRGWFVYGRGTVEPGGKQIVPDRGVRIWELSGAMIGATVVPPKQLAPAAAGTGRGFALGRALAGATPSKVRMARVRAVTKSLRSARPAARRHTAIAKLPGLPRSSSDSPVWKPTADNRTGDWRTGRGESLWSKLQPYDAADGHTALSGQALTLDGLPLPDVTVSVENTAASARTDGSGRFLLDGLPPGHHVLVIDGRTANRDDVRYGQFEYGVDVERGDTTDLGFPIWMSQLDHAGDSTVDAPTRREEVLTNPKIPGLEVRIPRGSLIHDADGHVVRDLNLTQIPIDRAPFPLPKFVDAPTYFTVQPGRAYASKGAQIVYPNFAHRAPGERIDFWNYDAEDKGWYVYGKGTVTPDGRQVMPDPGVRVWEFTGAMIPSGSNPPPDAPPAGGGSSGSGGGGGGDGDGGGGGGGSSPAPAPPIVDAPPKGGDPVDLSTGLFTYSHTDLSLPDVIPVELTRHYRPNDPNSYSFGVGMTMPYDMRLWSISNYTSCDLILPDGSRVHYVRISPGSGFTDVVYEAQTTPGIFYKSIVKWDPTDPSGGWDLRLRDGTVYHFGEMAPLQSIRDRFGNQVTLKRTNGQSGDIVQISTTAGRWVKLTYDTSHRITGATDNGGRTLSYTYTPSGRLETATDARHKTTTYGYDANGRMDSVKDPRTNYVVRNQYDANGRVSQQTMADGGVVTFDYTLDANGKVTATTYTNERNRVEKSTFNPAGYRTSLVRDLGGPNQQTTTWERDPQTSALLSITDPLNRKTAYEYDTVGNVTAVTKLAGTADAARSTFTYESTNSQITSATDPLQHTFSYAYDQRGRIASTTDPTSRSQTFGYAAGSDLPASLTDEAGKVTRFDYAGGQPMSVTDPLGRRTTQYFDALGRMTRSTDSLGRTQRYEYDDNNEVTKATDGNGSATSYEYDANGNVTKVTDARNHSSTATFDAADQLETWTDALNRTDTYVYDKSGNLIQRTDAKGQRTQFRYDSLNRRTFIGFGATGPAGSETYSSTRSTTYDAGSRARTMSASSAGTITNTYDGLDRLTAQSGPAGSVSYGYDTAGRRTSLTASGQPGTTYDYDDAGRLTSLTSGLGTVGFSYDGAGRHASTTLPNGISQRYGYDADSQLTSITYDRGGIPLGDIRYAYDAAGQRTAVWGSFARTGLPQALASATYDDANQLVQRGSTTYGNDRNGSLVSDGQSTYTWDAENKLRSITGGAVASSFDYDALGRRNSRTVGGVTTSYLYDGQQAIAETSGAVTRAITAAGTDNVFGTTSASGAENALTDAQGNTIALSDALGQLTTSYTYGPFGETTAAGPASANSIQYTGRENDGNGLYNYRSRYYDPATQRFISEDMAGLAGGDVNLYGYVGADPVDFADPSGNVRLRARQVGGSGGCSPSGAGGGSTVRGRARAVPGAPRLEGERAYHEERRRLRRRHRRPARAPRRWRRRWP